MTLIVNPFASSVTHRNRVLIRQILGRDHELTVIETTKGGHAIRLAHGAAKAGADVIAALGGDGTINEVANGLLDGTKAVSRARNGTDGTDGTNGTDNTEALKSGHRQAQPAIVPLPGGSTNVFARSLGYPNDPVGATRLLVEALAAGSIKPAGVGMANGRAFLFHVGAGFDAAVVSRVEARGPLKRYAGHPLFVAAAVATWIRGVDRSNPWFSVATDDGRVNGGAHLAIALNCNPYTYLGSQPLDLAPEAGLDDPLALITLNSLSGHHLAGAALGALRSGDGVKDGKTTGHWPEVTGATIIGYRPFPYQLDGEYLGKTTELRLEHRPNAIRLVMPAGDAGE